MHQVVQQMQLVSHDLLCHQSGLCRLRKETFAVRWTKEIHYLQRRALYKWRFAVADARRIQHAGQYLLASDCLTSIQMVDMSGQTSVGAHQL